MGPIHLLHIKAMKETLEILGFILCVTLLSILVMFISIKLRAETPLPENETFPPAIKDPCWYVKDCRDHG